MPLPEYFAEYAEPTFLANFVRTTVEETEATSLLAQLFPTRTTENLEYEFDRSSTPNRKAMPWRGWNTESPLVSRDVTRTSVVGEIGSIGAKHPLNEERLLRFGNSTDLVIEEFLDTLTWMAQGISHTLDTMRMNLLIDAELAITSNGIVVPAISFGRDSSVEVTAATAWTDTVNATALDDLMAWVEAYETLNSALPGEIWMRRNRYNLFLKNKQVLADVLAPGSGRARATGPEIEALLDDRGLPPIRVMEERRPNEAGTETYLLATAEIVMIPQANEPLGATVVGPTVEASQAGLVGLGDDGVAGAIGQVYVNSDSPIIWTKVKANCVPTLANPDLVLSATA